jgi:hypothetical protein
MAAVQAAGGAGSAGVAGRWVSRTAATGDMLRSCQTASSGPERQQTHLEASSFLSRSTSPPAILARASEGYYARASLMVVAEAPQAHTTGSENFGRGDCALIAPGPAVHSRSSRGDCHNADGKGRAAGKYSAFPLELHDRHALHSVPWALAPPDHLVVRHCQPNWTAAGPEAFHKPPGEGLAERGIV